MARVVDPKPSSAVEKFCACGNCGATIGYVPNDTFTEKYAYDYLGGYETRTAINCPNCGKTTGVK